MTGVEAAHGLLPAWVVWVSLLLYVPGAFVVSLLATWLGAAVAAGPLRRARDLPWAERARLAYTARAAARGNTLFLTVVHATCGFILGPILWPLCPLPAGLVAFLLALAAWAAATLVGFRVERRARQGQFTAAEWRRAVGVVWLIFNGWLLVLLFGLLAVMPPTFNLRAWLVLAVAGLLLLAFGTGRGFHVARLLGLVRPASARVRDVVARVSLAVGVPVRAVHELDFPDANAFAFPFLGRLAFTPKLLAVLDDGELSAVTAHELAHLDESWLMLLGRLLPLLLLLPLVAARPIINDFGYWTLAGVVGLFFLVATLGQRLSRGLERRADRLARRQEDQEGAYARALAKIYEANLVPLVEPGKGSSHPHLFDRLVSAGAPPDFPRPRPPSRLRKALAGAVTFLAWGVAWVGLLVGVFSLLPRAEGEQAIFRSLAVGTRTAWDLSALALLRWHEGRQEEAATLYRAAAEIDTDSPFYPANQAIVLAGLNRCEEAWSAAEEARRRQGRRPHPGGQDVVRNAFQAVANCLGRQKR
jgi:Zn-dependent protease with chaperone function